MSDGPVAAWYPDPGNPQALRWWDGVRWTEHTHPLPAAAPVAAAPVAGAVPVAAVADPAGVVTAQIPAQFGQAQFGQPAAAPAPYMPTPGYIASAKPQNPNKYAFITFGVVVLYLVLAVATGVVFIGILPLGMSIRSKSANEPLAIFAIGAAILSIIVSLSIVTHQ